MGSEEQLIVDINTKFLDRSKLPDRVYVWDETMRGGEQTPGVVFTVDDKIDIAKLMDDCGVAVIDAGFPIFSEGERRAIKALVKENLRAEVGATIRSNRDDVDIAMECGVDKVYIFSTTSRFHLHHKYGIDEQECEKRVLEAVEYASGQGLSFDFISEDTSRSSMDFVLSLLNKVIERGAKRIILCDTVSVITPASMMKMVSAIRHACPSVPFGVHCHNDFGLATANTLAAINAGVSFPTVAVNSLGDGSGNASLEEVVMACEKLYGVKTGIKTERLYELCKLVERLSGIYLSPQKPIAGLNSYRHESEVHVAGVLKHSAVYEPIRPEEVGRQREFVLGKHSGGSSVKHLLDMKGITVTAEQVDTILANIKMEKETASKVPISDMLKGLDEYGQTVLAFPEDRFWEIVKKVIGE
ncbi:MAG: homoaconitate hydratase [Thermoplasmata archaeon]|nr:MAG: homoaconitate hydratase [Thermoplasmata archaeon]